MGAFIIAIGLEIAVFLRFGIRGPRRILCLELPEEHERGQFAVGCAGKAFDNAN